MSKIDWLDYQRRVDTHLQTTLFNAVIGLVFSFNIFCFAHRIHHLWA
jgi:hypothetical protein